MIFAFSIHVALEAFSNSVCILRIAVMTYTVIEVVVHVNEVSNDLTRFIYINRAKYCISKNLLMFWVCLWVLHWAIWHTWTFRPFVVWNTRLMTWFQEGEWFISFAVIPKAVVILVWQMVQENVYYCMKITGITDSGKVFQRLCYISLIWIWSWL